MDLTIAMDDFGTGFSNLANLQSLPIDVLKIDGSFVTGMVGDRDKVAIVHAILSLARALGMRTVAEGVETAEVGQALGELGCDRGQGYYYARPMSADAAYAFWLERNQSATS
jgi:EAL domain-containing protein (putative c-di-GMP-specific phosphodiesterase class I)